MSLLVSQFWMITFPIVGERKLGRVLRATFTFLLSCNSPFNRKPFDFPQLLVIVSRGLIYNLFTNLFSSIKLWKFNLNFLN